MSKKILIVDDELDICQPLEYRFKKAGFGVVVAYDGKEALEKIDREKPDIIILDLMLPKLCGEEVCRMIKKDESTENIPVIMLTSKGTDTDRIIGKVIGADSYIIKPFEIEDLLREIYKFIGRPGE